MALGEFLRTEATHGEDVGSATIRSHLKLFVQPGKLVLTFDRREGGLRNHGLGFPSSQSAHHGGCFLIRVDRTVICVILVLYGSIGVECCLWIGERTNG
jgi:hypothetical protein